MPSNPAAQPLPTELFHITCLNNAVKVYETQTWKFSDSAGDRGMNLFDLQPGYTHGNQFEHTGARLEFRWLGQPAVTVSPTSQTLDGRNILQNQHPWRMFVGPEIDQTLMQIARIELIDRTGRCKTCGEHNPVGWLDRLCPSKRPEALQKMVARTNASLLKQNRFIKQMIPIVDFIPQR